MKYEEVFIPHKSQLKEVQVSQLIGCEKLESDENIRPL